MLLRIEERLLSTYVFKSEVDSRRVRCRPCFRMIWYRQNSVQWQVDGDKICKGELPEEITEERLYAWCRCWYICMQYNRACCLKRNINGISSILAAVLIHCISLPWGRSRDNSCSYMADVQFFRKVLVCVRRRVAVLHHFITCDTCCVNCECDVIWLRKSPIVYIDLGKK